MVLSGERELTMTVYVLWDIDFIVDIYDTMDKAEAARKERIRELDEEFHYQISVLVYEVK